MDSACLLSVWNEDVSFGRKRTVEWFASRVRSCRCCLKASIGGAPYARTHQKFPYKKLKRARKVTECDLCCTKGVQKCCAWRLPAWNCRISMRWIRMD